MLLTNGADPNLKVYNDTTDRNSQLRPVLVEYLASNERPSLAVVNLLIRYGARVSFQLLYTNNNVILFWLLAQVIMKTQFRDPDGTLNALQNVVGSNADSIFCLLLEASEAFDICMIRRNNVLKPEQKSALLDLARCPLSLMRQVRFFLRRKCGRKLMGTAETFDMPKTLIKYVLFDYSWRFSGNLGPRDLWYFSYNKDRASKQRE